MQGPLCCPKRALNSVVSPSGVWVPKAPLCCSQTWPAQPLSFDQGLMAYAAHEHHVGFEAPPCAENFAMRMSSACRCDNVSAITADLHGLRARLQHKSWCYWPE